MTSLKQLIQHNLNPFDPSTFRPGNFWQESQNPALEVDSIHWSILQEVDQILDQTAKDRRTRTILLAGDSGAGKSYLLGRLKRQLNRKAFFAYISPWPNSDYLWRHTLRSVVDSLIQVPEGQSESQLLLWLKGLPSLHNRSIVKWVLGERGTFIQDLQASFPVGITNSKEFFGVLYDLATNPELRVLAYNWLKGDNLDKEDLKTLRIKQPIDSEDAAYNILSNIGRIAASTQPIVLCFDNLDSIPRLANDKPDLQSLFNLNSTIHNEKLRNFLVLISIVTGTWRENKKAIQPADLARIDQTLQLKQINWDQAEALWAARLAPIYAQAKPKPESAIAPLSRDWLTHEFRSGRTLPRNALKLGQDLIASFKARNGQLPSPESTSLIDGGKGSDEDEAEKILASFKLTWDKEFQTVHERLTRIRQFTSPDLIWRLQQVLEALEVPQVTAQFLGGSKYASYSLSHQKNASTGVVWNEDPNMTTFYHVMKA
ncbi:MAG: ATP-binding protein [Cyanobacteria bacterium J06559_3]